MTPKMLRRVKLGGPLVILLAALLAATGTMNLNPRENAALPGQEGVRYAGMSDGLMWDCSLVDRMQYVNAQPTTVIGIPYLVVRACGPAS